MTIEIYDIIKDELQSRDAVKDFVEQYIGARSKEQRVYPNEEVAVLPQVPVSHIHYKEWQVRKASAARLINYLKHKNKALTILEVGCGNGWLSAAMSKISNSEVTGIDINEPELEQAKEVFKCVPNLHFIKGNIESSLLKKKSFDIIVFAASLQYFSSLFDVLKVAVSLLNKEGEIHIVDTHFYNANEISAAKERTKHYYSSIGFPSLADYYFHHSITDLRPFNYHILFNPFSLQHKLFGKKYPFYWIRIT
jgi:protein-L-isoaspartate O-methyltransferase